MNADDDICKGRSRTLRLECFALGKSGDGWVVGLVGIETFISQTVAKVALLFFCRDALWKELIQDAQEAAMEGGRAG